MEITDTKHTNVYYVTGDTGAHYKVVQQKWNTMEIDPAYTGSTHFAFNVPRIKVAHETWSVFAAHGIHAYARECDPEKPTYKRVVAAVQGILFDQRQEERGTGNG